MSNDWEEGYCPPAPPVPPPCFWLACANATGAMKSLVHGTLLHPLKYYDCPVSHLIISYLIEMVSLILGINNKPNRFGQIFLTF